MSGATAFFTKMLESSEMYCSLKYEDARGCPYNLFSPCDIATLWTVSALLSLVSLLMTT